MCKDDMKKEKVSMCFPSGNGFLKNLCYIVMLLIGISYQALGENVAQWRGPDRNGVFPEKGLLKSWPEQGPELLWVREDLDKGYSSVSVTDKAIYVTGRDGSTEYLTVLDMGGSKVWRIPYGKAGRKTHRDSRCTPTVAGDRVYLISGQGEVVCINSSRRKIEWSVPALEKFKGEFWQWEIAESPLLVDNKVIYTPGGNLTTMVALDKNSGKTIWQTASLRDASAFVSPILIKYGGKKIVVNVMTNYVFGVNAGNGKILWQVKYTDIQPPTFHEWAPKNNCITPLYHNGRLLVTSGYDHVAVMFKLVKGGTGVEQVWINKDLDCHHGQVVRVGGYIYGSNWIDNSKGNWCCVDWETGKTMYEKTWITKGSISAADGMLYCYEERKGNLALVKPNPGDFEIVSSFRITKGSGPHWTQPVIHKGVLYIRHGGVLLAFKIKA